jgi:prolyl-tRNA synthetase
VVLSTVRSDDPEVVAGGDDLYRRLLEAGVDVIYDDRAERPGVKFADAELVGFPYRVTLGPKGLASGMVELTTRAGLATEEVALGEVVERLVELLVAGRGRS